MTTVVSINENDVLDIIRKLLSPVVIGNCIDREKHDEYRNNVIFEYSKDLEMLQNCDIVIDVIRGLYSISVNSSYNKNSIIPFILCLIGLDEKRKAWCKSFVDKYIVDEYKDKFNSILRDQFNIQSRYFNFYNMSEDETVKWYKGKWSSVFEANILNHLNIIRCVTEEENCEKAINVFIALISDPIMLMIFDYILKITYGIVNGTDIEDLVSKFNSFSEENKMVAMRFIDKYFSASYREILYTKLKAGIHR